MARDLIKSDLTLKACRPKEKPYRISDGKGLFLLVKPDGAKYWRLDYSIHGKRKQLSLGVYPDVSLKQVRIKALEFQNLISDGIDPSETRKQQKQALQQSIENQTRLDAGIPLENSFEDVANRWLKDFEHSVKPVTFGKISRRIEKYILPNLSKKQIASIKSPEILEILLPIIKRQALETAHRVLNDCNRIFKYAVAHGLIEYDPSQALSDAIPPVKVTHRAAITEPRQIGQLMRDIENYPGTFVVHCALKLSPLLFARPGEIRQMEWKDIDFGAKEWRYFVTKTETEQIVPLSKQAIELLKLTASVTGSGKYVFPSARNDNRPMSNNTIRIALRTVGYDKETMSAHGFRTMASTILNEQGWSPDAIERQLAHSPRNKVRAAYNRAQYLDERRRMMQAWADYLDTLRNGSKVKPIKKPI